MGKTVCDVKKITDSAHTSKILVVKVEELNSRSSSNANDRTMESSFSNGIEANEITESENIIDTSKEKKSDFSMKREYTAIDSPENSSDRVISKKVKTMVSVAEESDGNAVEKLKNLEGRNQELAKRVADLENMVSQLREQGLISAPMEDAAKHDESNTNRPWRHPSRRGGRPKHKFWEAAGFVLKKLNDKSVAFCTVCKRTLKNTAEHRLKTHRNICSLLDQAEFEACEDEFDVVESIGNDVKRYDQETKFDVANVSVASEEEISSALACLFVGCHIPLGVVESDHFKNFLKQLRPSYRPPSRRRLATCLLDKARDKVRLSKMFCDSSNRDVVLLINDENNTSSYDVKNVVCMISHPEGQMILFDATVRNDHENVLFDTVQQCVQLVKDDYNANIYAVVSTMSGNLTGDIWLTPCNSYNANLLAKSLFESDLASRVNDVLTVFKSPELERQLTHRTGREIVLAKDDRLCSYQDAYACLLKNLQVMRNIFTEKHQDTYTDVSKLLFDVSFELRIQDSLILFDPVCELIDICQRSDTTIADAVEAWLKLNIPAENERYETVLRERLEEVINPVALAANYLHPVYKGNMFRQNGFYLTTVDLFLLEQLNKSGLNSLDDYKSARGIFAKLFNKHFRCPRAFWSLAERKHRELSNLAMKLIKIPASTRNFKHCDLVNSEISDIV